MVVESAFRPAGAPWGPPKVLSHQKFEEFEPSTDGAQSAQAVVDRNGYLTVIWERHVGLKDIIQSVTRAPGGSWTAPVDIAEFTQGFAPEPWLAVDWEGNATAVWRQGEVVMSSFRVFGMEWGEPIPLSEGESFVPQAAMDGRGDATAVWMHYDGSDYVVESAYRPEQGEWGEPTLVSEPGEEGGNPHVAVDGKGDSLVVWRGEDEGHEFVRAAYRSAGGSWSEPENVSTEGEQVQSLRAALDPEGNAIVAWSGNGGEEGEHDIVRAAFRPVESEWEEPVDLSADGGNGFPSDVVFNQSGDAAIVWQRWDGATNLVQAAYRPAGEEWEEPVDLSEEGKQGMNSTVVLDAPGSATVADGDATAIWVSAEPVTCSPGEEAPCFSYVVQAAGYNPDGLPVVEVEAPEEAVVGAPVEVSTPTEGLYSPQIEFGDGTKVAGAEATHVYEEPGEYTVRAVGAEELGYQVSAEQTIRVLGDGDEGEPDPGDGGGSGGADPPPPPPPNPPLEPVGPSAECLAARAAREAAATRLRRLDRRLDRADGSTARRRLRAAKRKQVTVLRKARLRVAEVC
jgi:PKD domain-containing protein